MLAAGRLRAPPAAGRQLVGEQTMAHFDMRAGHQPGQRPSRLWPGRQVWPATRPASGPLPLPRHLIDLNNEQSESGKTRRRAPPGDMFARAGQLRADPLVAVAGRRHGMCLFAAKWLPAWRQRKCNRWPAWRLIGRQASRRTPACCLSPDRKHTRRPARRAPRRAQRQSGPLAWPSATRHESGPIKTTTTTTTTITTATATTLAFAAQPRRYVQADKQT